MDALTAQRDQLTDPATVERLARSRLHMVRPGETAYVVIGGGEAPDGEPHGRRPTRRSQHPWYSQLWHGVAVADRAP